MNFCLCYHLKEIHSVKHNSFSACSLRFSDQDAKGLLLHHIRKLEYIQVNFSYNNHITIRNQKRIIADA